MNRRIRSLFAGVMLCALAIPMVAQAEWVQKEIQWKLSGVTADGSSIYVRDTLKAMLGGGTTTLDTTGIFSLNDGQPLPRGVQSSGVVNGSLAGAAFNDTTIAGWLVFQADTTATPTATLSTMTLIVEGRAAGFGPTAVLSSGWVKMDSVVVNVSTGNVSMQTLLMQLRTIGPITGQNAANNIFAFAQLRARVLTATGVLSSARAFVRYWRPTLVYQK